ncbi:IclR family transcriptional regulator [Roseomonas sp. KE2513]|uniref:IclR family transcriptional regulator n=1 Tax=Roseomonas sp. KE2513 TaxID=2479202 RepID=UPI0018DFDC8E|nr:IclR family transcriptional regulator [Roseomonas sp. KE2513]MBI0537944.1 IclR family transcriptional regulator [Roseomonas sp. KE2513]
MPAPRNLDPPGVRAADTVLSVLETVAWAGEPIGVTQIAQSLNATKSAIFRHLQTLVDRVYVIQDADTNRYRLGPRAFLLGYLAPRSWDLAQTLDGPMRELRDAVGSAVVLSTPTPQGALVVSTHPGTHPIEIGVRPGSELPLHASAQGKVFLAFGSKAASDRVLRGPLAPLTDRTITDPDSLAAELARIREQGYATAPEETLLGCNALAVPIHDHEDRLVASIALVGSIQHITTVPGPPLISAIRLVAEKASRLLGQGLGTRVPTPAERRR